MKNILLLIIAVSLLGCGTLAGSSEKITVMTEPDGARIVQNGNTLEKTPGTIELDSNSPTDRNFSVEKEGYQSEDVRLNTSIDGAVVFLDLILGGWPLLIDLATGNLDSFDKTSYSFVLRPVESQDKDVSSKPEDTEETNSVFASENKESDNETDSDDSGETSSSNSDSDISLTLKNSSYEIFESTITVLESIKDVEIKSKTYENEESVYNINSKIGFTELVNKVKDRTDKRLKVNKLSEKEIILEVDN